MKLHRACILTHNISLLVDFYKKIFMQEPGVDGGVYYRFYDTNTYFTIKQKFLRALLPYL